MLEISKRNRTLAVALSVVALVGATGIQAQGRGQGRGTGKSCEARFAELDTDQSGSLTVQELEAGILARFAERTKRHEERQARRKSWLASKGLSEEEMAKRQEARKQRFEEWKKDHPELAEGRRGRRGHGQGPGARTSRLDTDGDGAVSAAEVSAAASQRFQKMDADADGAVTAQEFAAARPEGGRRGHHKGRRGHGRRGRGGHGPDGRGPRGLGPDGSGTCPLQTPAPAQPEVNQG